MWCLIMNGIFLPPEMFSKLPTTETSSHITSTTETSAGKRYTEQDVAKELRKMGSAHPVSKFTRMSS
jgi:hypothetical protein